MKISSGAISYYITLVILTTIFDKVITDDDQLRLIDDSDDDDDHLELNEANSRSVVASDDNRFQAQSNVSLTDRIDNGNVLTYDQKTNTLNRITTNGAVKTSETDQNRMLPFIITTTTPIQKLVSADAVFDRLINTSGRRHSGSIINDGSVVNNNKTIRELSISPVISNVAAVTKLNGAVKDKSPEPTGRSSGANHFVASYIYNPFVAPTYRQIPQQSPPTLMFHGTRRFQRIGGNRGDDVPPEMMPPPPSNNSYADYANIKLNLEMNEENAASNVANDGRAECTLVNNDICLETSSYPDIEILESIGNVDYRHMFRALIDDTVQILKETDSNVAILDESPVINRREEINASPFYGKDLAICKSKVRYARPKKARSMNGQWKFVVNTAEYRQTIRLETCEHVDKSCSYLTDNVNSRCTQIFNYHRLLTWDETNGLSLDIFKVPTCCSCQIENVLPFLPPTKPVAIKSTSSPKLDPAVAENSIIVDEPTNHQPQLIKPNRYRNKPTFVQQNVPKREFMAKVRRPPIVQQHIQHQQQQQQHQVEVSEARPNLRYMTMDASVRKPTVKVINQRTNDNDGDRIRQPMIMMTRKDNFVYTGPEDIRSTDGGGSSVGGRINYNYHPIIDFFKSASAINNNPSQQQQQQQQQHQQEDHQPNEERSGIIDNETSNIQRQNTGGNNWMPITTTEHRP